MSDHAESAGISLLNRPQQQVRRPALLTVRRKPGRPCRALVGFGGLVFEAAIGKGGISAFKREGDGATPLAAMDIVAGYWRADRLARPRTRLAMSAIRHDGGWCDAPWHGRYNRPVRLPFPASAETMARTDHLYDIVLVLDWNYRRRAAGRGSAIFMHIARPGYRPTEGCVALERRDMLRLLEAVGPRARVRVDR